MRPFPPENRLELVKRHALVDFLILGNALVELELFFPFSNGKRRDGAMDRLPFGNRQAGFGKPRGAADEDQTDEREKHDAQPDAQQAAILLLFLQGSLHHHFRRTICHRHAARTHLSGLPHTVMLISPNRHHKTRPQGLRHAVAAV
ncbi:hypothetical protein D3C78_1075360 [compost metagenome]